MTRSYEVTAKEKTLRYAILATPLLASPIPPAAWLGLQVVWIVFTVLAAISGGYVALFYAIWLLGVMEDGTRHAELIGDDSLWPPPLYWPFGRYQKHVRFERRIRALERDVDIRDPWPIG